MSSAFEKRVKRRVIARPHTFFAVCPPGLTQTCHRELSGLGEDIQEITPMSGGIQFTGRLAAGYRANLCLSSPSRILMRLAEFKADSFKKLEQKLANLDWELFLPEACRPTIRVTCHKSRLYHSQAVAQRCEQALHRALGLPSVNGSDPTLMVRAVEDVFELSLDMSGEPLYKRGIKSHVTPAPLRENLAFAILTAAGVDPSKAVLDPMCGSGTFSFECARLKAKIPAGFFRSFAFETWPAFKPAAFSFMKKELAQGITSPDAPPIFASDRDKEAMDILALNLKGPKRIPPELPNGAKNFLSSIQSQQMDFFDLTPPQGPKGAILLNPPYGKRLDKGMDTQKFYRDMGKKLKSDFKGWQLGIIFPGPWVKGLDGIKLNHLPFFHGGLDLVAGVGRI